MNRHSQPQLLKFLVPLVLFLVSLFFNIHTSYADVGTAALYSPPYLPTACYGDDESQFPSSNLFAAAGDAIWANGTACGRLYLVKCIDSTSTPYACNQNQTIQIKIVDHHHIIDQEASVQSACNTTLFLTPTAFGTIANSSTSSNIIIEFERVHGEDVVPLARGSVSPSTPNPTTDDRRVPLARGPVSPSAPNPTTDDRRGHYKVHGEDVVPLARDPVSPSAPNHTTDNRRGHYKVRGEDVVPLARGSVSPFAPNPTTDDRRVPLARGPVSPSAPNPTTDDRKGHYKDHGEDVVPLARSPVSPSAPNPTTDDRRGHYKVHGEDVVPLARGSISPFAPNPTTDDRRVPLARGPVSPSAPNPTTDDRRGHYKVHGEDVPLTRGPVPSSAPNPSTEDAVGHYP